MAQITTEDCKALIESEAAALGVPQGPWKRVSKTKTPEGQLRVFTHPSAGELEILEPNGATGASDLRLTRRAALDESGFNNASPEERLGLLWVDTQLAAMGQPTRALSAPREIPFDTWAQVRKAFLVLEKGGEPVDARGEEVEFADLLSDLAQRACATPQGFAVMAPSVEWAFELELADFHRSGPPASWDEPGMTIFAISAILPGDAADWNATPLYFTKGFDNLMESIFRVEFQGGATRMEEMNRVGELMGKLGCSFSKSMQKGMPRDGAMPPEVTQYLGALKAKAEAGVISESIPPESAMPARSGPRM